ncbi:MAG: alpha/beta hydrolase [Mizugakiibacter sp.]|uniref:alpha/beta hydrolase n=1 Tax=Mizugakiibacter sp. TaxID=1972610 RepID=UPI0031BC512E|nr:esterase family protein [Xanthomonadaceae bacterium]
MSMRPASKRALRLALALLGSLALAGCLDAGTIRRPLPSRTFAAPHLGPAHVLVVVLPGRGDDLAALERAGIVGAIQDAWPDADVTLTAAGMPYYRAGLMPHALRRDVIAPARTRGYRAIWLLGASLGGMGEVLYARDYPQEISGMIMLAPYLGDAGTTDAIRAAGGLRAWDPGPAPPAVNGGNYQRELWRSVRGWLAQPGFAARVWVGCGSDDPFMRNLPLLREALPSDHVIERPGGHRWSVWVPLARSLLQRIDDTTPTAAGAPR